MDANAAKDKTITLGHPSYVWLAGQERRLQMILRDAPVRGRRVLDAGCGLGLYLAHFAAQGASVHGIEYDGERALAVAQVTPHALQASAEALPYADATFDLVFSNEVLEHVQDDRQAVREAVRALAPGGRMALFVPNRLYPFETHGFYWRGVYHFGNIPLVSYLPDRWRDRLCPHVRAYRRRELRALFDGLPGEIVVHRGVFAGYDMLASRRPILGRLLRWITHRLEATPLQWFGLSHYLVFRKASFAGQASDAGQASVAGQAGPAGQAAGEEH
jgi:SAM-dependent methyltransferase